MIGVITDTVNWTNIKGSFIAVGDEKYLTIGNFNDDFNTTVSRIINNESGSRTYYYIDGISVYGSFVMPSAFTPNNDDKNDIYLPVFSSSSFSIETFRIYNRWSEKVYEVNGINEGWNGKYNEELQPVDDYTFYIEVKNEANGIIEKRIGSFSLLR